MSTTTELLAANERYDRLRARIETLADEWVEWGDGVIGMESPSRRSAVGRCGWKLRALLADA